jgi:hypothetical protein
MTAPRTVKISETSRISKSVIRAGLSVARVEKTAQGTIVVIPGPPLVVDEFGNAVVPGNLAAVADDNPWDGAA